MKKCSHLGVGDGGCRAVNTWLAGRCGGAWQAGYYDSLGSWAEPAVCSYSGSATQDGGYLATPPTFASCSLATICDVYRSLAAACGFCCRSAATWNCSSILFKAYGHSCGLVANFGNSCSFLATPSPNSSCGYPAIPSCPCGQSATCGYPCGHLTLSSI